MTLDTLTQWLPTGSLMNWSVTRMTYLFMSTWFPPLLGLTNTSSGFISGEGMGRIINGFHCRPSCQRRTWSAQILCSRACPFRLSKLGLVYRLVSLNILSRIEHGHLFGDRRHWGLNCNHCSTCWPVWLHTPMLPWFLFFELWIYSNFRKYQ